MDLNRNHFFLVGIVLILLGIQFRYVSAVVLNDQATEFVSKQFGMGPVVSSSRATTTALFASPPPPSRRTVELPRWLGFACISSGVVCVLHALVMPKPGG